MMIYRCVVLFAPGCGVVPVACLAGWIGHGRLALSELPLRDGEVDGPTVARVLVGSQLRRLREERGLTRAEAAEPIGASESKISRMELGRVPLKERDVSVLLSLYGVHDDRECAALLARVRETNVPCWWHAYSDLTPNWLQRYLGLEAT